MPKTAVTGIAVILLTVFALHPLLTKAQIAPTNSATISGSVSDSTGKPVAGAKVLLAGPKNTSTQTDSRGQFALVGMPFGTYRISAAFSSLGMATKNILVQGDITIAIQYEPLSANGLKTIATVSSSANAIFNVAPASITQVSPFANAFQGVTSWRAILEQIPGVAQAGLGAGNSAYGSIPTSPLIPMQVAINGALPYETAVLLDDMPLIGGSIQTCAGSGTNLAVYPVNGFGTADVIRGPGAAAPSIVDSIGGSFLMHPPGIVNADHYDLSLSTDAYGGIVANAMGAFHWKKLSATLTYGVNDSPGPFNSGTISSDFPTPTAVNGQAFVPYSPPCNLPTCIYGAYLIAPNYALASFPYYGYQQGFIACCINQNSAWSQHGGSIALNYALSSAVNAEIFYAGQQNLASSSAQNYTINFLPPSGYNGSAPSGNNFFPTTPLTPYWAQEASSVVEEKITAQIGRGQLRIAALQNRTFAVYSSSSLASENLQLFGGGTLNGTAALFNGNSYQLCSNTSVGCSTGTYGAPIGVSGFATTFSAQYGSNFLDSNNRDLLLSYSTPIGENYHAGFSFVKSYYDNPQGLFNYFESVPLYEYGNLQSSSTSETTDETRIFIGGNPSEKTSFDLSMYFANATYHVPNPQPSCVVSFPGGTETLFFPDPSAYVDSHYSYAAPRLGLVWRPSVAVAVRASAGGGFAEAPLKDFVGTGEAPFCNSIYCTVTLSNMNLQPERSFSFDLGTDIRLRRSTLVSFDIYRSNLYGQIYNATSSGAACSNCGGLPLYTTEYGNLGVSRFEGILVDVHHDVPQGIYWALSGGLTRGYLVSVPPGFYNTAGGTCVPSTGANCANLTVVPNVNFNGTFAASIPYAQGLGTLGYRWSPEKYADLTGIYYGNNNTYFRPAFVVFNGHISYPLSQKLSLLVTFLNITGMYDASIQTWSSSDLSGAPTISGLPYPQYGEEYGPRTVLLATQIRL